MTTINSVDGTRCTTVELGPLECGFLVGLVSKWIDDENEHEGYVMSLKDKLIEAANIFYQDKSEKLA